MDWIWSWKDYVFYGICSCSPSVAPDGIPENNKAKRNSTNCDFYSVCNTDADYKNCVTKSELFNTAMPNKNKNQRTYDFLSMLSKMQGQRLNDQRCELPVYPVSYYIYFNVQKYTYT
uniref:PA2c domain-containing protein n=1 Tax=Parastrongyloides trichosuri TaxID=131310 RepID=A0A0N5A0E0_PARTI